MSYFHAPHGPQKGKGDDVLVLTGDDDEDAVGKLASFLRSHSVEVLHESPSAVMVEYHMRKFALAPKISKDGLDRIVVHEFWAARPGANRARFIELVNRLNNEYNTGGFYVDRDGDLAYQTQMTFMDTLTWEELDAFLTWHDYSLLAVLFSHKDELVDYLR